MKKTTNIISISYNVANTNDNVNDAIGREIHEVEVLKQAGEMKRAQLVAFVKENIEAIEIPVVEATLKANGYARQRICDLLREYGIVREDDMTRKGAKGRKAAKATKEKQGAKVEDKFNEAKAALMKLCGNDKKLFRAVITRLYQKAK